MQLLDSDSPNLDTVEKAWEGLRDSIRNAAEKTEGFSKHKANPWISEHTIALMSKRDHTRNKATKSKLSNEIKKCVQTDKNNYYNNMADKISHADKTGITRKVHSTLKQLTGKRQTQNETLKDEKGEIILDVQERLKRWATHLENFLNRPPPTRVATTEERAKPFENVSAGEPSEKEVAKAISKLKRNKAGGTAGIPPELLKDGGQPLTRRLTELLNLIWYSKQIPNEWKIAIVVPVFKKGDKAACANYRGISLLVIAFKVPEAVLKNRLEPADAKNARENQAGFKPERDCRDQIFSIRQIIEQREEY